ncbi:MAG: GntR family transcriptional regulator [Prolixibacteraceae bacterium]|nr:GntR family transcriptional regulator [Prolixibacteraceae bacterium]
MARHIVKIDNRLALPKYKQIILSIEQAIEKGILKKGDKIHSINQICSDLSLSRDTVMMAFNELKAKGILISQAGKGHYVASTEIQCNEHIFVLFDELNAFKEDLYNSLMETLKDKASVDIYFHNYNFKLFTKLILESVGNYTSYIIMPATFENTSHLMAKLPKGRVFMLDRYKQELKNYPVVYQDFEMDFYSALSDGLRLLKKYRKLVFVHSGGKEPAERIKGFKKFCSENNFDGEIVKSIDGVQPGLYQAYFLTSDRDLVELVKKCKKYKYKLGKNFGIVSLNDTELKEIVARGITTISTDFTQMGKTLGEMVLTRRNGQIRNPSKLIVRRSL